MTDLTQHVAEALTAYLDAHPWSDAESMDLAAVAIAAMDEWREAPDTEPTDVTSLTRALEDREEAWDAMVEVVTKSGVYASGKAVWKVFDAHADVIALSFTDKARP